MTLQPTDLDIASLVLASYEYPGELREQWDYIQPGLNGDVHCRLKHCDGYDALILPGSQNAPDWIRDFYVIAATPHAHPILGPLHVGFYLGLDRAWATFKPMVKQPVVLGAHSLGAGRVKQLSGIMAADGMAPIATICFGEPCSGYQQLEDYVAAHIPRRASYRNGDGTGHDPVTDVPLHLLAWPYIPSPKTDVSAIPPPDDEWDAFSFGEKILLGPNRPGFHHIQLYRQALERRVGEEAGK